MKLKPSEIKVGKRIRQDNGELDLLAESLKGDLLGACITVSKEHKLIDGFRRLTAWKKNFGDKPIDVFVYNGKSPERIMEAKMLALHKSATPDEIYEAGQILEKFYVPQAKVRSGSHREGPKGHFGQTRKFVAKDLGIGEPTYKRVKRVMTPELDKEIGKENAEHVRETARKQSVRTAEKELKDIKIKQSMGEKKYQEKQKSDINKFASECLDRQLKTNAVLKEVMKNINHCNSDTMKRFFSAVKRTLEIIKKEKGEKECQKLLQ